MMPPLMTGYLKPTGLLLKLVPYPASYLSDWSNKKQDCGGGTWRPPITRSRMKGMMAQKSTRFMGCLKKRHFLGEQMKRTRYSMMKKRTAQFSVSMRILSKIIVKMRKFANSIKFREILFLRYAQKSTFIQPLVQHAYTKIPAVEFSKENSSTEIKAN
jgi:hypothetical protein